MLYSDDIRPGDAMRSPTYSIDQEEMIEFRGAGIQCPSTLIRRLEASRSKPGAGPAATVGR